MKAAAFLLAPLVLLVLSAASSADDSFPPSWRGGQRTVHAEWDTWQSGGGGASIAPDAWSANPATVGAPAAGLGTTGSYVATYEGRNDVIELNQDDDLWFELDNYDQANPLKTIRVQVTYYLEGKLAVSRFNVWTDPTGQPQEIPAVVLNTVVHPDMWATDMFELTLTPNPEWEKIGLKFEFYPPAYVDQVVIDTRCVPEPAAALLLAPGLVLASAARRRRRGR